MSRNIGEGVFQGRLANLALKFTTKWLPFCFGPRRRTLNSLGDCSPSHAVSVCRQAYQSPYDRAVRLLENLLRFPSIAQFLYPILVDEKIKSSKPFKLPTEPLQTLFERGYTLNIILNELESPFVATIDLSEGDQVEMFWRGCLDAGLVTPMMLADEERFELTLRIVGKMLNLLDECGKLGSIDPRYVTPRSIYPHASESNSRAAELARTEIAYVHDLERLVTVLDRTDVLYGCAQNLAILHREFSMRVQYLAAQSAEHQLFNEAYEGLVDSFDAYSRFCAERVRSSPSRGTVDADSLLMRPVQRLAQYPLIFESIVAEHSKACSSAQFCEKPLRAAESANAAMQRSKRILRRANEATREALNEKHREDFFARIDVPPPGLGPLLTSGVVSARTMDDFLDVEAFLFDTRLILCRTLKMRPARPSRVRRTLSAMHLAMISSPPKRPKRQSASSSSSATLHGDELEFRLPEIDTVSPPAGLLLSSHVSLATLRDPPRIAFTSSPDVTIHEENEDMTEPEPSMDPLVIRSSLNIDSLVRVSQTAELGGTARLTMQFATVDGSSDTSVVFRHLNPESAALWLRMIKRALPLVAVEETSAHSTFANPGFSHALVSKYR
ncbi:Guanine nucleotide exchange factor for Cdc42p [Coemansia interrupta]|uniref:Guanine nucleotide exchange factor for Cdc42p n=1 Tax=Coemansia interrupta TaxID=1126814 RepID=A0A9W8HFW0_9FUNG|nr:Guanine nucleotide exchange factor for Cdc42p [Coemansia interrupta]